MTDSQSAGQISRGGFLGMIAVIVLLCTAGLLWTLHEDSNEKNRCEKAGGVFVAQRENNLCLAPGAVIPK